MKSTKTILSVIAALISINMVFAAGNINIYLDYNRFLDKDNNTIMLLDYQVPHRSMVFLAQNNGYYAELNVSVKLFAADSLAMEQNVTDNIGIRNKADADNSSKSYLNRLSFLLTQASYTVQFNAFDPNSQKSFSWQFKVDKLSTNALMSDIELNSEVRPDSLQYLPKFQRNNILYRSEPSILINKETTDHIYLYLESYCKPMDTKVLLNLSLVKDSLIVMDEYMDFVQKGNIESLSLKIPLEELKPGKYSGTVFLQTDEESDEHDFEFVLFEEQEEQFFLFSNPDEEYQLMRYFLGSQVPGDWKDISFAKKRRYGTQFWRNMAATTKRNVPEAVKFIQDRVDYANRYFSHLKPGWTSDMGRIYIRNGAADDVQRETSSDESRFVRKDYQIWKYASGQKPVYMFIDVQMNGNYRLIYVENDDMESSNPDWMRYVGADFDNSKLNN